MGQILPSIDPPKHKHVVEHYYIYPPGYIQQNQQKNSVPYTFQNQNPTNNTVNYQKSTQPFSIPSKNVNMNTQNNFNPSTKNQLKQKNALNGNQVPIFKPNFERGNNIKNNNPSFSLQQNKFKQNLQPINKKQEQKYSKQASQMQEEQIQRLQSLIKQYEAGIDKAKQYGRKMQDPNKFLQFKNQSLKIYVQNLKQFKFPEKDVGEDGRCVKAIVGRVSSGKSSLLNTLLGLDLQIGHGQTTLEPAIVFNQKDVAIIDTPGQNQDFNTQQIENIKLLSQANYIFILYPDSLKNAQHLIKVITAIKPKNTILIRTKCDRASKKDNKTLQQQIQSDYKVLKQWGIIGIPIYATSAYQIDGFDNNKVKELLLKHPLSK